MRKKSKKVALPLILYKQSQLVVNGKAARRKLTAIGNPVVRQRAGRNVAILSFKIPMYFWWLFWVSILGWIAVFGCAIREKF